MDIDAETLGVEVFTSALEIPPEIWDDLVPDTLPFLRLPYLRSLERACSHDMEFRYVLFRKGKRPLAVAYFQLFHFDTQKLASYISGQKLKPWQRLRHEMGRWVEKLAIRPHHLFLINGNAFLSGEHGFYYDPSLSSEEARSWLLAVTEDLEKRDKRIFASLIKDVLEGDAELHEMLLAENYYPFKVEPDMELVLSSTWKSFEDYLSAMSSKYRQRARSTYRKSTALVMKDLDVEQVRALDSELFQLYTQVLKDDKFCLKEIGEGYFSEMKGHLGEDFIVTAYYLENELLAFSTAIHEAGSLEAHFIGYKQELNQTYKLYQRILYDLVDLAISEEVDILGFGRTAMEIKSCLGAHPHQYYLYLRLSHHWYNRLIRPLMQNIPQVEWQPRNPFRADLKIAD